MDASMKFFVRTCLEGVRCTWSYTRAGGNVVHSAGRWGNRGNASDLLVHSATAEDCTLALTLSLRLESCFIFGVQRRLAHTLIYSTLFSRRRLRTSNTPSPNVASPTYLRGRKTPHPHANLLREPARLRPMPLNVLLESDRVPDRPRPMRPITS